MCFGRHGEEHTLLKFSSPQSVSQSVARLARNEVRGRFVDRFQSGLEVADYPMRLAVRHKQETLPRVGL